MMRALEDILEGEIIFALDVVLVDIIVFISNTGYAYALCIALLIDDEAAEVVLAVTAGVEGEEVQPSLCARAKKLENDLGELD